MRSTGNTSNPTGPLEPQMQAPTQDHAIIQFRQLSERFRTVRGFGVGFITVQKWQVMGMPHIRQGRMTFYRWDDCWAWYQDQFSVGCAV